MQTSAAVVNADAQVFRAYNYSFDSSSCKACQGVAAQLARFPKHKQACETSTSILKPISLLHKRSGSPRGP